MFYYFCRHFSTLLDRIAFYIITILGIIKIIITNFFQLFFERKYFILCMRALIFPLMYTLFTSLFCFEPVSYTHLSHKGRYKKKCQNTKNGDNYNQFYKCKSFPVFHICLPKSIPIYYICLI